MENTCHAQLLNIKLLRIKNTGNKDPSIYPSIELLVLVMTQMTYKKVKPTYVKKFEEIKCISHKKICTLNNWLTLWDFVPSKSSVKEKGNIYRKIQNTTFWFCDMI